MKTPAPPRPPGTPRSAVPRGGRFPGDAVPRVRPVTDGPGRGVQGALSAVRYGRRPCGAVPRAGARPGPHDTSRARGEQAEGDERPRPGRPVRIGAPAANRAGVALTG